MRERPLASSMAKSKVLLVRRHLLSLPYSRDAASFPAQRLKRAPPTLANSSSNFSVLLLLFLTILASTTGPSAIGAINKVLPHPKNPDILYVGSVNGGIWKAVNATSSTPVWTPLTDHLYSLSIGALTFDYTDTTYKTIVAGFGSQSSDSRLGGLHLGVIRSTDGGNTWTVLGTDDLYGYRISGIYAAGNTISICAVGYGLLDSQNFHNGATFSSIDEGVTWVRANAESCTDMQTDRTIASTVFRASSASGITVSRDSGVTWSAPLMANYSDKFDEPISTIRIAVKNIGTSKNVKFVIYAGFVSSNSLKGLFRGVQVKDNQYSWIQLDLPSTEDNGVRIGLISASSFKPGGGLFAQPGGPGMTYFSIAMDFNSTEIVYVGGDRQPAGGTPSNPSWPNSIGATTFDGRLFRCNSSLPAGTQCTPLTHSYAAANSAPHADSRDMVIDASGRLVESDDGGIYVRTKPLTTTGQWYSLNNKINVQQAHSVGYVGNNMYVTGNQDTGVTYGVGGGNQSWTTLATGDGGVVRSRKDLGSQNSYTVYYSNPFLANFSSAVFAHNGSITEIKSYPMQIYNSNNTLLNWVDGPAPAISFYQNFVVNRFNPNFLVVPISFDHIYLTTTKGELFYQVKGLENMTDQIGPGVAAYGGKRNGVDNSAVLYVAGRDKVAVNRPDSFSSMAVVLTNYPPVGMRWPQIADLAIDPENWAFVAVLGVYGEVAYSKDRGVNWNVLPMLPIGVAGMADSEQRRIVIVPGATPRFVVAGRTGVYVYQDSKARWWRIATATDAYVSDLVYDINNDLLYIATLGRGAWSIPKASEIFTDYAFAHSIPTSSYVRPPKVPAWETLTYVFAALVVVLFLLALVLGVAFLTTKLKDEEPEDSVLLLNEQSS